MENNQTILDNIKDIVYAELSLTGKHNNNAQNLFYAQGARKYAERMIKTESLLMDEESIKELFGKWRGLIEREKEENSELVGQLEILFISLMGQIIIDRVHDIEEYKKISQ